MTQSISNLVCGRAAVLAVLLNFSFRNFPMLQRLWSYVSSCVWQGLLFDGLQKFKRSE